MKEQTMMWMFVGLVLVVGLVAYTNGGFNLGPIPGGIVTQVVTTTDQFGRTITTTLTQTMTQTTTPTTTTTTTNTWTQTTTSTANSRAPTSLTVQVSPNPVNMGGWMYGDVYSNGYNYPVTCHVRHLGAGQEQAIGGLLAADGQFTVAPVQMNTPGYWRAWATTTDGVTSNMVDFTCIGVKITGSDDHWSRSFENEILFTVLSDHTGTATIKISKDGWATSNTIGTTTVNQGGFGTFAIDDFGMIPLGTYEVNVEVGGDSARAWTGGTCWIVLGR